VLVSFKKLKILLTKMNNEKIGITAEVLLCEFVGIDCSIDKKRTIKNEKLKELIKTFPKKISRTYHHIGHKNNSTDFLLDKNKTLSLKTTKSKIKKLCPATIGFNSCLVYYYL
jgi:hypothetical protein